jgi:hypothetical protein
MRWNDNTALPYTCQFSILNTHISCPCGIRCLLYHPVGSLTATPPPVRYFCISDNSNTPNSACPDSGQTSRSAAPFPNHISCIAVLSRIVVACRREAAVSNPMIQRCFCKNKFWWLLCLPLPGTWSL